MTRSARWALRCYPPSFRSRYGGELAALAQDAGPAWRHTLDLYRGAARAWLRPVFVGDEVVRGRLQASVVTVWVAWCAGMLVVPGMTKALLDPPGPHAGATVRNLLGAGTAVLVVGSAIAMIGAGVLVWRALVPALREGRWSVLGPLAPALVLGVVELVGLAGLALVGGSAPPSAHVAVVVLGVAWGSGLVGLLACAGFGPAVTLARLQARTALLRLPAWLAAALAACLVTMAGISGAAVAVGRDATLLGSPVPVAAILVVAGLASLTALISATRGILVLVSST